ncbi:MAG: hypothetical protein ACRD0J_01930 [Acidimicrobiales bacterium]
MSDRANRALWIVLAVVLVAMGGVGLSFALGAWGAGAANADIVTGTLVGWWREGSWMSFAAAAFIGLSALLAGLALCASELSGNGGRSRLGDFSLSGGLSPATGPGEDRGRTVVRAASLHHGLEADLRRIPGVEGALVSLFGTPEDLEVSARLRVDEATDLDKVVVSVHQAVERLGRLASVRPGDSDVTVSLVVVDRPRLS